MSKGRCLVVGAGVSGLSTGIRLLEDGLDVDIWSSKFSPNTTSDVAAALWYPFLSAPIDKTDSWGASTYDYLKELSRVPETGIEMTKTYEYFREPQEDPSWKNTVDDFVRIVDDLPANYVECFCFTTSILEVIYEEACSFTILYILLEIFLAITDVVTFVVWISSSLLLINSDKVNISTPPKINLIKLNGIN